MAALELWQMANIEDVAGVPGIVAAGARNDAEVAAHFGRTDRQGRYMIKAAEILGLVTRPRRGQIEVTPLGKTLMASVEPARRALLRQIVSDSPPGREMLNMLRFGPLTIDAVIVAFSERGTSSPAKTTLRRRLPELLRWLIVLDLAVDESGRLSLSPRGARISRLPAIAVRPGSAKGAISRAPGRILDVERRDAIERAAVARVSKYYADQGFNVITRERENLGWDLDIHDPLLGEPILVEVKGTSRRQFVVELSHNEYANMQAHRHRYRVCIVTDALGARQLREFVYNADGDQWVDATAGTVLRIQPLTAARLSL